MLLIGAVAGFLAGVIVKGYGFGVAGNIVVGIVGALVAGLLLPRLGPFPGADVIGQMIPATIGAVTSARPGRVDTPCRLTPAAIIRLLECDGTSARCDRGFFSAPLRLDNQRNPEPALWSVWVQRRDPELCSALDDMLITLPEDETCPAPHCALASCTEASRDPAHTSEKLLA